jgi:tRNA threonylcarbamoyladenosine biosynthesis protein TsaE
LVEWPEKGQGLLPAPDLSVDISYHQNGRMYEFEGLTPFGVLCVEALKVEGI